MPDGFPLFFSKVLGVSEGGCSGISRGVLCPELVSKESGLSFIVLVLKKDAKIVIRIIGLLV